MMTPAELIASIYLGDRGVRSVLLDGEHRTLAVQIDCISRIRDPAGLWNFYSDEDIPNGSLVFTEVSDVRFSPAGPMPNDFIYEVSAQPLEKGYHFHIHAGSVDMEANHVDVHIDVIGSGFHLIDPRHPELAIVT